MSLSISNSKVKKYLLGFVFFLLCLFIFDRGLYYLISSWEANLYSKNKYEKHFEKFVKDKNFTALILGTSRSYEGIHPYYLEKVLDHKIFKEAFQGKGPKYFYYFYQLYKKYAGVPKIVIYGVDYFIYNITSDPMWMSRFHIDHQQESIDIFSSPLLLLKHKKKIDNFYNNLLIHIQESGNNDSDKDAFQDFIKIHDYRGNDMPNSKKKLVSKRFKKFRRGFYFRYPGVEGEFLMKLLEEWQKDNVTVFLVALPDYFGTLKTNFKMRKFVAHLRRLEQKFNNLVFLNYDRFAKFPLRNKNYFLDGGFGLTNSHLSMKGAKLFNSFLGEDIKKYLDNLNKK